MRLLGRRAPGSGAGIFTGHSRSSAESGFVMLASATLSRRGRAGKALEGSASSPVLTRCGALDAPARRVESPVTSPPDAPAFTDEESPAEPLLEQPETNTNAKAASNEKVRQRAVGRGVITD